jgi:hypothetical protein
MRRLRWLPVTQTAWEAGELSTGQVDAIISALRDRSIERFAEAEADLVPTLRDLNVDDTVRVLNTWAAYADADGVLPPPEPKSSLTIAETLDGQFRLVGDFDALSGATIATAVRVATTADGDGGMRTAAQRRADALTDICRFFLDNQTIRPGGRHRPHLNVVIDEQGGRLVDGPRLTSTMVDSLLCDSAMHRVLMASRSAVIDYGVSTRTIAAPLWNALVVRDEHCRYPGCDRPSSWCDGHHAVPFPDGPTSIDNLVLMCRRHHQMLHKRGWHAKLRPEGTFHVTTPWGLVRESRPPGTLPLRA